MNKFSKIKAPAKVDIKKNLTQIIALTEKNIRLNLRFKVNFIISLLTPLITIAMPLIIMNRFFPEINLIVYQFIAYKVYLIKGVITEYPSQLRIEKYWKTLPALIIGPFHRINLLLGIFLSRILLISIPFSVLFIITFITAPINFITIVFIILIYFLIAIILSGIGLLLGIFAVSNENFSKPLLFAFNIFFWLSCITYPYDIFPPLVQTFINLNPLYYIFDILRLIWLENNVIITISTHFSHFLVLISLVIIIPLAGVYVFNLIYKKYGIVGY